MSRIVNRDGDGRQGSSILRVLWLIWPVVLAGIGHAVVLRLNLLPFLAVPIDRDARWRGREIFGAHKTWRGLVVMAGLTAVLTRLQTALASRWGRCSIPPLAHTWRTGAAVGLAYSLAELPNSFVKRRLGILPGRRSSSAGMLQYAADQMDSVAGCLLALHHRYRLTRREMLLAALLGGAIHVTIDAVLYAAGIKRR